MWLYGLHGIHEAEYMKYKIYMYKNSVSPHEVHQVSGSVTSYTCDMILDKISGTVTSTSEHKYTGIGQVILSIQ